MATLQSLPTIAPAALERIESAKRAAALRAVEDYFSPNFEYVGIGSGSTILYVIEAIKAKSTNPHIRFVPTGYQSREEVRKAGLKIENYDDLPEDAMLDIAFDGADEVDDDFNCVKGGGACLYQEKLVATKAKKFVCVADYRKDVNQLLTRWPYIPVEVEPLAVRKVIRELRALGSPNPTLRTLTAVKEGPLQTDQGNYIVKAPFPPLLLNGESGIHAKGMTVNGEEGTVWGVTELAAAIKSITGVLEVGIFSGMNGPEVRRMGGQGGQKPVAVYFGMEDGSVKIRRAPGEELGVPPANRAV